MKQTVEEASQRGLKDIISKLFINSDSEMVQNGRRSNHRGSA